jgi:tRNA(Ile)-lysidine synthetase-like protein
VHGVCLQGFESGVTEGTTYHRPVVDSNPKADLRTLAAALRPDRAVAEVIRSWRELTGGAAVRDPERRTLIACSGGVDSSALALSLAAASEAMGLVHVVHDLRPAEQALADRDAVKSLAARLGVPFLEVAVKVRAEKGNAEAVARRLRYQEMSRLASEGAWPYLATAHQGDDQLETMLMRLMRGAGLRGLAGIRESRELPAAGLRPGVRLVRPMLGIERGDCERICKAAGLEWREDLTNLDTSRLRAAVRASVVPQLRRLSPRVAQRARVSAGLLANAADLVSGQAEALLAIAELVDGRYGWTRAALRGQSPLVLGGALRLAAARVTGDVGQDRLTWRLVRPAVNAILDASTEPREFRWKGATVTVKAGRVEVGQG